MTSPPRTSGNTIGPRLISRSTNDKLIDTETIGIIGQRLDISQRVRKLSIGKSLSRGYRFAIKMRRRGTLLNIVIAIGVNRPKFALRFRHPAFRLYGVGHNAQGISRSLSRKIQSSFPTQTIERRIIIIGNEIGNRATHIIEESVRLLRRAYDITGHDRQILCHVIPPATRKFLFKTGSPVLRTGFVAVHRHTLQSNFMASQRIGNRPEIVIPLQLGRSRHLIALQSHEVGASMFGLAPRRDMRESQHGPSPVGDVPSQNTVFIEITGNIDNRRRVDNLRRRINRSTIGIDIF